jgi:hypothetical protein
MYEQISVSSMYRFVKNQPCIQDQGSLPDQQGSRYLPSLFAEGLPTISGGG